MKVVKYHKKYNNVFLSYIYSVFNKNMRAELYENNIIAIHKQ